MNLSVRKLSATAVLFASFLLNSSVSAAARTPTNKELRIGTTQEFENLNPLIYQMSATSYLLGMTRRSLLAVMDEKNVWVPLVAEQIPTLENGGVKKFTENGKEKVSATWQIRSNAVWGDGKPITAKDFKFAWEVGKNENVAVTDRATFTDVERIEMDPKNPKKITLVYADARWDVFRATWGAIPEHLERPVYEKFGNKKEGYDKNSKYTTDAGNPGLYSGPYRVKEIKLGSHIELVRNEKFFGTQAKIEKIIVRVIPNSATLESNLISGEIDLINQQGMSLDQALEFEKRITKENLPFKAVYADGLVFEHIDFHLDSPLVSDVKVRRALIHAIDREALVKALFQGKQKVAHHSTHPTDNWFSDNPKKIVKYEYSQRKARKLLAEAGWKAGSSGVLEKDGRKLELVFMTTAGNKLRENVQVFIKDQWKKIGVETVIKNEPAKVFFGETVKKRKYTDLAMYAWISTPESDPKPTLNSKSIPSEENGWSGQNNPGWRNAKVDVLTEQIQSEFSSEKRKAIFEDILAEYTSDLPTLPLYYRANVIVVPKKLSGLTLPAGTYTEAYHVERWNLADDKLATK